jgi:uncharacterized protein
MAMTSYAEPGHRTGRLWQVIHFPLVRIILASLALLIGVGGVQSLVIQPLRATPTLNEMAALGWLALYLISSVIVAFGCYRGYVRVVEQRWAGEVSRVGAVRALGAGAMIGAALFAAALLPPWLLGYVRTTATPGATVVIVSLAVDIVGAVVEELLLRGILFRIAEEVAGTWLALVVSVLVFSGLHAGHTDSRITMIAVVGLAGGLLPSAAYVRTRRLWLPIGIHAGWDLVQNIVFGVAIAGHQVPGVLHAPLPGPMLLTGGNMGPEGSIAALVAALAMGTCLLVRARQHGRIVHPIWRRKRQMPATIA